MDDVPYDELPHDDYGPWMLAIIWVLGAVAGAFMGLRLYCKFTRQRGLWWDDHFMIAAWLSYLTFGVFVTIDVSYDFGKHNWDITPGNWSWLLLHANLSGSFSIIAASWSKTSFALTLLRIANERWMKYSIWFIAISINVALGLNVLFTWIQCWPVEKTWRTASTPGTCWPKSIPMNYNVFTASYSGAMDIVLAILPWKIIWGLTMTKREKLGVSLAMSMGVFAGVVSFIKIKTITAIGAFDIIDTVELVIWGAAESAVTIMAASIPILRALIRDYKPPPARFVSDEESMLRRLGVASARTMTMTTPRAAGLRRSRSEVELNELGRGIGMAFGSKNELALQAWRGREAKADFRNEVGNGATLSSHFDAFGKGIEAPKHTHAFFDIDVTLVDPDVDPNASDSGDAGVLFGVISASAGIDNVTGFYAAIDASGAVILGQMSQDWVQLASTDMSVKVETKYHLRVTAVKTEVKVFVDDMTTPKTTYTVSASTKGTTGVRVFRTGALYDNLSVAHP